MTSIVNSWWRKYIYLTLFYFLRAVGSEGTHFRVLPLEPVFEDDNNGDPQALLCQNIIALFLQIQFFLLSLLKMTQNKKLKQAQ